MPDTSPTTNTKPEKKENLWVNLIFNIIAPSLILSKLSNDEYLGTTLGLIIALCFPLGYGLLDFVQRKKVNVFSVLGIISTLLTGTISLLKLPPEYIAIKEAAIPGIIFVLVLISSFTPYSLVEKLLFNEAIFNLAKLDESIDSPNKQNAFDNAMRNSSLLVAASFALSSTLNYILAVMIVVSDPGTAAYNEELGKMTALSYPVIALPSTIVMVIALFYLLKQIQKITGHPMEYFLNIETPDTK